MYVVLIFRVPFFAASRAVRLLRVRYASTGKVSGTRILKYTRYPADSILDHFVNGYWVDYIANSFYMDAGQVQVVYDYCVLEAAERHPRCPQTDR